MVLVATAGAHPNVDEVLTCSLARKLPQFRQTGNTTRDLETRLERQAQVQLSNLAFAFPKDCAGVVRHVKDRL